MKNIFLLLCTSFVLLCNSGHSEEGTFRYQPHSNVTFNLSSQWELTREVETEDSNEVFMTIFMDKIDDSNASTLFICTQKEDEASFQNEDLQKIFSELTADEDIQSHDSSLVEIEILNNKRCIYISDIRGLLPIPPKDEFSGAGYIFCEGGYLYTVCLIDYYEKPIRDLDKLKGELKEIIHSIEYNI